MGMIKFFGYGANRSPERLRDILGKKPIGGYGAVVEGYILAYQTLDQIPEEATKVIKTVWGETFRAYTIKLGSGIVAGVIWELEETEFEKLKEWEFVGIWRETATISVKTFDGRTIATVTEKAPDASPIKAVVDGLCYENNLNLGGKKILYTDEYKVHAINQILGRLNELKTDSPLH